MTGGFANRATLTGCAFSGGSTREEDFPPLGFVEAGVCDGAGNVEFAGGSVLLSLVDAVAGVGEVNADCAHDGST